MVKIFYILIILLSISGCALTKDHILLDYTPQQNIDTIRGSDKVNINLNITDARSMRDKVSYKKNAYGMEMAEIISDNNVIELLKEAIKSELQNRGFKTNGSDIDLDIELIRFFNDFKSGFFAGDAAGEVIIGTMVKRKNGSITYKKTITGKYVEQDIQLATGKNAKIALEGALKDAVSKLVNDPEFIKALMES